MTLRSRHPQLKGLPLAQYITRCQHCQQIFRSSGIPIIGEAPEQATASFVNGLVQHMIQKHPQVMQACAVEQAKYGGLMVMAQFTSDDPELLKQKETARHAFFKQVQSARISDAKIEERVNALLQQPLPDPPPENYISHDFDATIPFRLLLPDDVIALMKEFRDVLEENLQDQPQPAIQTPNGIAGTENPSQPPQ